MLRIAKGMRELSFEMLMEVYREENEKNGKILAPFDSPQRQRFLAEQEFQDYLRNDFFCIGGARCAIWETNGKYVSALRLEPYQDGFLLSALETAPHCRRNGYACQLLRAVQGTRDFSSGVYIYSHVRMENTASLALHRKCGFQIIAQYAHFLDGTVDSGARTMRWP